jgi:glyoxylase I family protein
VMLKDRLVSQGASVFEDLHLDDGSNVIMMRDPWGVPLQLCERAKPML